MRQQVVDVRPKRQLIQRDRIRRQRRTNVIRRLHRWRIARRALRQQRADERERSEREKRQERVAISHESARRKVRDDERRGQRVARAVGRIHHQQRNGQIHRARNRERHDAAFATAPRRNDSDNGRAEERKRHHERAPRLRDEPRRDGRPVAARDIRIVLREIARLPRFEREKLRDAASRDDQRNQPRHARNREDREHQHTLATDHHNDEQQRQNHDRKLRTPPNRSCRRNRKRGRIHRTIARRKPKRRAEQRNSADVRKRSRRMDEHHRRHPEQQRARDADLLTAADVAEREREQHESDQRRREIQRHERCEIIRNRHPREPRHEHEQRVTRRRRMMRNRIEVPAAHQEQHFVELPHRTRQRRDSRDDDCSERDQHRARSPDQENLIL